MGNQQTLGDVVTQIIDCEHKTAPKDVTDKPYGYSVGTPHIRNGHIVFSEAKPIDYKTYNAWTKRGIPAAGDLILAREAPIGQVGLVPEKPKVALGQRTVLLRVDKSKCSPRYLQYRMLSPQMQETMKAWSEGSTVPHLNVREIGLLPLGEMPDVGEQHGIARVIGSLDDKIVSNARVIDISLELAGSMCLALLDGMPSDTPMGDLINLAYGRSLPARDRTPGPYPVVGSGGASSGHHEWLVAGPGIVVGRKGSIGSVYWIDENFTPIDTTFFVQPLCEEFPWRVAYFLLQSLPLGEMNNDSAVPGLNRSSAQDLLIPNILCDEIMQLDKTISVLFDSRRRLLAENRQLEVLRDVLLSRLMDGTLTVHTAEDVAGDAV